MIHSVTWLALCRSQNESYILPCATRDYRYSCVRSWGREGKGFRNAEPALHASGNNVGAVEDCCSTRAFRRTTDEPTKRRRSARSAEENNATTVARRIRVTPRALRVRTTCVIASTTYVRTATRMRCASSASPRTEECVRDVALDGIRPCCTRAAYLLARTTTRGRGRDRLNGPVRIEKGIFYHCYYSFPLHVHLFSGTPNACLVQSDVERPTEIVAAVPGDFWALAAKGERRWFGRDRNK